MADSSPTLSEMQDSLAHYGVKGMKWGVRKSQAKAAVTSVSEGAKKYKTLALGSVTPVAVLMGLGPPASVALGLGIFAVQQPPLNAMVTKGAEVTASVAAAAGATTMSAMQAANLSLLNTITTITPTSDSGSGRRG